MIAVYPGSFDPVTYGHIDIISRASRLVDKLIVAVLKNSQKKPLFSVDERIDQLLAVTKEYKNVEVLAFTGLLADFAATNNARLIIRGLRAVTDFEHEFQMALANRKLNDSLETLFITASDKYLYLSSSLVKEIAMYGGNLDEMVPPEIKRYLDQVKE